MTSETLAQRAARHLRLAAQAHGLTPLEMPAYLALFVNSTCNLQCEHCGVHARLNQPDDLRLSELVKLSEELSHIEQLDLLGGEPFLHDQLVKVCAQFMRQNTLRSLSITSNGFDVPRIVRTVEQILSNSASEHLARLTIELSIDGSARLHNRLRGHESSFDNAIQSYYGLAALQRRDARLRLRVSSIAMSDNLDEIERLSSYLYERCPQLERHSVTRLRAECSSLSLRPPELGRFLELDRKLKSNWADRERDSLRKLASPALHWAQLQAAEEREQIVPCKAGVLSAVVHANGDVAVCENLAAHPILGNLREDSFRELWGSPQAQKARTMIRTRQCACSNERALLPSLLFQPGHLARAYLQRGLSPQPRPLPAAFPTSASVAPPASVAPKLRTPKTKTRLPLVEL
jgi:MoaA/NifB/PqqE/SkfB family radical SAM enzyme